MYRLIVLTLCVFAATPAAAQTRGWQTGQSVDQETEETYQPQPQQIRRGSSELPGRTADSSVGKVGERKGREDLAINIAPMGRIAGRIQNRVQSRIRNRIDRNYDPQANAKDPFAIAEAQSQGGRRP